MIESVCEEEDDSLSNVPENLQETDRYVEMEDNVDQLNDAVEKIEEAQECLAQIK